MKQMTDAQRIRQADGDKDDDDDDLDLMGLLIFLVRNKKLIIGLPLLAAAISVAISLSLPDVYKATTKLMPPLQAQSAAAALLSQLGGVAGIVGGGANIKNSNDLYVGMLRSRTIADNVITRYNLKAHYDASSLERARIILRERTVARGGKDGLISIEVADKNPELAAALANAYVEELLKLTKVMAVTDAAQRRLFFEQQLEQVKNNLAAAEVKLKGALDTGRVASVDSDSRAMLATVARVRAQISAKEIEISAMRPFVTSNNPDAKLAAEELRSLQAELAKLESGGVAGRAIAGDSRAGLESVKIVRDVKYHQMLYELLAKQYEIARLDESKDATTIQVLDRAVAPEAKSGPNRALIVIMSTVAALFAAVGLAFIVESTRKVLQSSAGAARWNELLSHLSGRRQ